MAMMMRKPDSDAIEMALIDAGRRGESASASAAKSDTSMRSAANRRKIDVRTGGGAAASTSTTAGCSSTSSNRITPSRGVGGREWGVGEKNDVARFISHSPPPTPHSLFHRNGRYFT